MHWNHFSVITADVTHRDSKGTCCLDKTVTVLWKFTDNLWNNFSAIKCWLPPIIWLTFQTLKILNLDLTPLRYLSVLPIKCKGWFHIISTSPILRYFIFHSLGKVNFWPPRKRRSKCRHSPPSGFIQKAKVPTQLTPRKWPLKIPSS